tara:strand:+ start:123 stop:518 length:396 start_codon:yes stop_codon:yes gene_type:complete
MLKATMTRRKTIAYVYMLHPQHGPVGSGPHDVADRNEKPKLPPSAYAYSYADVYEGHMDDNPDVKVESEPFNHSGYITVRGDKISVEQYLMVAAEQMNRADYEKAKAFVIRHNIREYVVVDGQALPLFPGD